MNSYRTFAFAVAIIAAGAGQAQAQWLSNGAKMYYNSGNVGIGTTNPAHKLDVRSSGNRAISAQATANSGETYGVWGQSKSPEGVGLFGYASAISGVNFGLYGKTNSPDGYAAYFEGDAAMTGNLGIGIDDPQARLHIGGTPGVDGIKFPDGTVQTTAADPSAQGALAASAQFGGFMGNPVSNASSNWQFFGPSVNVALAAGQRLQLIASAPLGTFVDGGSSFTIDVGYQLQPGGSIQNFSGGNYMVVKTPVGLRNAWALNGHATGLAAGTYKIGILVRNTSAALNDNNYANLSYMIFNAP